MPLAFSLSELCQSRFSVFIVFEICLTFMHHASYIQDRRTATPQSTLFIYLVNKYI